MITRVFPLLIVGWMFMSSVHAQTNPCEGKLSGFVQHADCTRYYSCVNGVAYEKTCPAVFPIFRPDTQMCDLGNPAECVTCPASGLVRFPVSGSCTRFVLCVNGVQSPGECLNGLVFDPVLLQCNLAANVVPECVQVTCPAIDDPAQPTFKPHPSDCGIYFICVAGQPIQQQCPAGTGFNPSINVCDLQSNVQCPVLLQTTASFPTLAYNPSNQQPASTSEFCTGNKGILYVPDLEDCSRYYMCMNEKQFSVPCSSGLIFDPKTSKCGSPEKSACLRTASASINPCSGVLGLKYVPDQNECSKYYMCMSGKNYGLSCPTGELFDTVTTKCQKGGQASCFALPQENPCKGITGTQQVPDPNDCFAFYLCLDQQPFHQKCAPNLIFDVVSRACNRPENSICTVDLATPPTAGPPTLGPTTSAPVEPPAGNEPTLPQQDFPTEEDVIIIPTAPTAAPTTIVPTTAPTVAPTMAPTIPQNIPEAPTPAPTVAPIPTAPTPAPTSAPSLAPTTALPPAPTPAPSTIAPAPTSAPIPTPAPAPPAPSPSTPTCHPGQVYYQPHPDCTKFFRCVFGTLFVLECPMRQHWNQSREYCDHIWNVACPS